MAMERKKPPARILRPPYETGTAERDATAGDKYHVDFGATHVDPIVGRLFGGPRGIRGPDGEFDARPGMTETQLYDEVARLNAGLPVSPVSQGIGRKPRRATEAARWVEILLNVPETRAQLLEAKASGAKLSPAFVRELMTFEHVVPAFPLPTEIERKTQEGLRSEATAARLKSGNAYHELSAQKVADLRRSREQAEGAERKLIDAVGRQLARVLEMKRSNWETKKR
jgi:hypothetical protein